jgi:hypothetical protein
MQNEGEWPNNNSPSGMKKGIHAMRDFNWLMV